MSSRTAVKKIPTTMPGGQPFKKAHTNSNLSALRNHAQPPPSPSNPSSHPTPPNPKRSVLEMAIEALEVRSKG